MAYIYKKQIGGKSYYYLRASEKKGTKVLVKDLAYLGSSLEDVKKSLEHLPLYKEKIRKAYKVIHQFLESNHYLEKVSSLKLKKDLFLKESLPEVEACQLHYHSTFSKLDELSKKETWHSYIIEFAFNTASIEGNTITLKEARNLLEEGLTPKDRTLREIYDLQNTEKVFFELLNKKEELTHELITKTHLNLMKNIDARYGYRLTDVRVIKSHFEPTPAPYVKADMELLLKWYQKNKLKLHPFVLAVIFHHKFERIHPFMDGNGRTGRMLLNYILMKSDSPPVIIHRRKRKEYLDVLGKADKSSLMESSPENYSSLVLFVAEELTDSYWSLFL